MLGLIGILGKVAGSAVVSNVGGVVASKVAENIGDAIANKKNDKANREQANYEQINSYCRYIQNNLNRYNKTIADLVCDTNTSIEQVRLMELTGKYNEEEIQANKDKTFQNLKYLYLIRDFFTALAKHANGVALKEEELLLVNEFVSYFDGVPVLNVNKDSSALEKITAVIPLKVGPGHFEFEKYLSRYSEKIEMYVLPEVNFAVENFNSAMKAHEIPFSSVVYATTSSEAPESEVPVSEAASQSPVAPPPPTTAPSGTIECPNCHEELAITAKFCHNCGTKIEKRNKFCIECGEKINPTSKFCSNCGTKIG